MNERVDSTDTSPVPFFLGSVGDSLGMNTEPAPDKVDLTRTTQPISTREAVSDFFAGQVDIGPRETTETSGDSGSAETENPVDNPNQPSRKANLRRKASIALGAIMITGGLVYGLSTVTGKTESYQKGVEACADKLTGENVKLRGGVADDGIPPEIVVAGKETDRYTTDVVQACMRAWGDPGLAVSFMEQPEQELPLDHEY